MNATTTHTIGGLPADLFVNRRIRFRFETNKMHMMPAKLIKLYGDKADIHPDGHKNHIRVPIAVIKPWWSQNPDLAVMHHERQQLENSSQAAEDEQEKESEEHFEIPESQATPVEEHPNQQSTTPLDCMQETQTPTTYAPASQPSTALPAMVISGGTDLLEVLPLLTKYQQAMEDRAAALVLLEPVDRRIAELKEALASKGVTFGEHQVRSAPVVDTPERSETQPETKAPQRLVPAPMQHTPHPGRLSAAERTKLQNAVNDWVWSVREAGGGEFRLDQVAAQFGVSRQALLQFLKAGDPLGHFYRARLNTRPHRLCIAKSI